MLTYNDMSACHAQMGTRVHDALASTSGQSIDDSAEEAKRKLPKNRPSAVANFILDQFLPLGLLVAMVVGCATRTHSTDSRLFRVFVGIRRQHCQGTDYKLYRVWRTRSTAQP